MSDDDDNSFYNPVPSSILVTQSSRPSTSQEDPDPDSDDSFDNFQTQKIGGFNTQTNTGTASASKDVPTRNTRPSETWNSENQIQKKPPPQSVPGPPSKALITANQNLENRTPKTAFVRYGSDNSFFRDPSSQKLIPKVLKNTPPSALSRPSTPSGELIMLKNQLENERKDKVKKASEWQKSMKEMSDRLNSELQAERDKNLKLQKNVEMLTTMANCRKMDNSPKILTPRGDHQHHHHPEIRRKPVQIPTSLKKPNGWKAPGGNAGTTPRRIIPSVGRPLSAFRHDNSIRLPIRVGGKIMEDVQEEDTFQLEDSFEPSATSTPRVGFNPKCINSLRRELKLNGEQDENRGAPVPKRRRVWNKDRMKKSRIEVVEMRRKHAEKFENHIKKKYGKRLLEREEYERKEKELRGSERSGEKAGNLNYMDSNYAHMLSRKLETLRLGKTREVKKVTKSKLKEMFQQAEETDENHQICMKCRIDRIRSLKKEGRKEWEEMEDQRLRNEKKLAEGQLQLMYSTALQSISRQGFDHLTTTKNAIAEAEKQLKEKCDKMERRKLESLRNEAKEVWRAKFMDELREKEELHAGLDAKGNYKVEKDDYIWTSDSGDEDLDFPPPYNFNEWTICESCFKRQKKERRVTKREREKIKIKVNCFSEYGKEQREQLRNMSILTKSKIEAADKELNKDLDELMSDGLLDNDEDEDNDSFRFDGII